MIYNFNNVKEYTPNGEKRVNAKVEVFPFSDSTSFDIDATNMILLPGFADVHVHLREPGFSYKETVASGTAAAAAGGYTDVCTMPNLSPVPDSVENLDIAYECIKASNGVRVHPYGAITVGEKGEVLSDMDGMASRVCAFSDDGRGVQTPEMMKDALLKAKALGKLIAAHEEDNSLLFGGVIHDGEYAKNHSLPGICSESEWGPIARDIELLKETGASLHICHISTKESVDIIRKAKAEGVDITCETAPHYLVLDDSNLQDDGKFKMNPPLRSAEDKKALIEGICDGTIDMIATDHAPHSAEEKAKGLLGSMMGVVGLECAFPVMYTEFVKKGIIDMPRLTELMCTAPRERFSLKGDAGFSIWDMSTPYRINPDNFKTLGRATPFEDREVYGKCLCTSIDNKAIWISEDIK